MSHFTSINTHTKDMFLWFVMYIVPIWCPVVSGFFTSPDSSATSSDSVPASSCNNSVNCCFRVAFLALALALALACSSLFSLCMYRPWREPLYQTKDSRHSQDINTKDNTLKTYNICPACLPLLVLLLQQQQRRQPPSASSWRAWCLDRVGWKEGGGGGLSIKAKSTCH